MVSAGPDRSARYPVLPGPGPLPGWTSRRDPRSARVGVCGPGGPHLVPLVVSNEVPAQQFLRLAWLPGLGLTGHVIPEGPLRLQRVCTTPGLGVATCRVRAIPASDSDSEPEPSAGSRSGVTESSPAWVGSRSVSPGGGLLRVTGPLGT